MSTTVRRVFTMVFSSLTRVPYSRGMLSCEVASTVRLNSVQPLSLSSQRSARSKRPTDDEEVNSEPMKFSTSKGSHSAWKVNSMGSQHAQPLRRVLSVSLLFSAFLLWCALRGETDIDAQLGKELHEQLPDLFQSPGNEGQKPK